LGGFHLLHERRCALRFKASAVANWGIEIISAVPQPSPPLGWPQSTQPHEPSATTAIGWVANPRPIGCLEIYFGRMLFKKALKRSDSNGLRDVERHRPLQATSEAGGLLHAHAHAQPSDAKPFGAQPPDAQPSDAQPASCQS
jgi:hypothetical protein